MMRCMGIFCCQISVCPYVHIPYILTCSNSTITHAQTCLYVCVTRVGFRVQGGLRGLKTAVCKISFVHLLPFIRN